MKVDFYKHNLSAQDKRACMNVLSSIFLTTGSVVSEFEQKFAKYTNNEYAIGVNSCTDALFLVLKYYDIKFGDEIITTPLSFIATSNVIEHCNATPVFVDVEPTTGNIDANLIESKITKKTKAILVVHLYGQMCDMKKIRKIADKYSLKVIEDCAHCIEGQRDRIKPGNLADAACFSFYATKNITSGEGGAITCHDKVAADWYLKARSHGMTKNAAQRYTKKYEHYDMEFLGYKTNMTNIQASLLINQLDKIDKFLNKKEQISQAYTKAFSKNKQIGMPSVLNNTKHARHLYTIWVNPKIRDEMLDLIQNNGVGVAVNFRVIHLMHFYKQKYGYKLGDFPNAEKIGNSTITLPLYAKLSLQEVKYVIKTINASLDLL